MHSVARGRTAPPRRQVALIAILIGAIWAFGGRLPLGTPQSDPLTFPDHVRVVTFSLMLAAFALVAWLVVGLASTSRWVLAVAAIVAIGGSWPASATSRRTGFGSPALNTCMGSASSRS